MAQSEDDFWNASTHSGFNFDDEEEDDDEEVGSSEDAVFVSLTEYSVLPMHAIISKRSLDIVLDDIKSSLSASAPPIEEILRKIQSNSCCLNSYVKFTDKLKLLDKAIEVCDANIIIKIIVHMRSTLKINIFYHQLSKRKSAIKHYAHYLFMRNQLDEIVNLYMATGNSLNLKYLYYLIGQGMTNKGTLYRKLEQFIAEHLQKINSSEDKVEIYDNLHLIKFQMDQGFNSRTVVTQLAELCKRELSTHKGLDKLLEFKKTFRIDEFTFEWTLLNVLASMKLWMHINDIFIKNNWLTKKNTLKTEISVEVFLTGLNRHDPPKDVLEALLGCLSDSDKAFALANKLQCHTYIIQYYTNQRDRLALLNYKSKVPHQSSEYYLIESALQSTVSKMLKEKRWKN